MAKKDMGEINIFWRVESRATEDNRPGAYLDLMLREGSGWGRLETFTQYDLIIVTCLSLFLFLKEDICCSYPLSAIITFWMCGVSWWRETTQTWCSKDKHKIVYFHLNAVPGLGIFSSGREMSMFYVRNRGKQIFVRLETSRLCFTLFFISSLSLRAIIHSSLLT